jgi:type IV pilus biogenesis protein CpaD/CtpE
MKKSFFVASLSSLLMLGCEKQYKADDGYIPEFYEIDTVETKSSQLFTLDNNFNFSDVILSRMNKLLKAARAEGKENVSFVIIANRPVDMDIQEKIRNRVYALLYKTGFINSRIIDSGLCIYKSANTGVRIDILKYEVNPPDCSLWSEYIGDMDTNKNLPKFGMSDAYNLTEMIGNKADFVVPRKYKGPQAAKAIAAIGSGGSAR